MDTALKILGLLACYLAVYGSQRHVKRRRENGDHDPQPVALGVTAIAGVAATVLALHLVLGFAGQ